MKTKYLYLKACATGCCGVYTLSNFYLTLQPQDKEGHRKLRPEFLEELTMFETLVKDSKYLDEEDCEENPMDKACVKGHAHNSGFPSRSGQFALVAYLNEPQEKQVFWYEGENTTLKDFMVKRGWVRTFTFKNPNTGSYVTQYVYNIELLKE